MKKKYLDLHSTLLILKLPAKLYIKSSKTFTFYYIYIKTRTIKIK